MFPLNIPIVVSIVNGRIDHGEETGVMSETHDWRVHSNGLVQCKNCGACPCHSYQKVLMECENPGRGN